MDRRNPSYAKAVRRNKAVRREKVNQRYNIGRQNQMRTGQMMIEDWSKTLVCTRENLWHECGEEEFESENEVNEDWNIQTLSPKTVTNGNRFQGNGELIVLKEICQETKYWGNIDVYKQKFEIFKIMSSFSLYNLSFKTSMQTPYVPNLMERSNRNVRTNKCNEEYERWGLCYKQKGAIIKPREISKKKI
ncbi:hypothetical protein LguiA_007412 [Lonicera macranthoides]